MCWHDIHVLILVVCFLQDLQNWRSKLDTQVKVYRDVSVCVFVFLVVVVVVCCNVNFCNEKIK